MSYLVSNIRDNLRDGAFQLIDPQYYSTIRQRGQSYESELKISNVTEEEFGLYTCYASNHIGAEYNSAFLNRYVRPTKALPGDRGKAIKGAMSDYLLSFLEANLFSHPLDFKVQFWYLRLNLAIETVSCRLLQRMERMDMD